MNQITFFNSFWNYNKFKQEIILHDYIPVSKYEFFKYSIDRTILSETIYNNKSGPCQTEMIVDNKLKLIGRAVYFYLLFLIVCTE